MIKIGNIDYRNLEEQVQKNKEDIANHYNVDRVLADFGIKIIGQVSSFDQIRDRVGENYGDAYAVGTQPPYTFYIWTRADIEAGQPDDYWFDIGELAIVGPQGPQGGVGPAGPQGTRGSLWYKGNGTPSNGSYNVGDMYLNTTNGDVYRYEVSQWIYSGNIRGPQGLKGDTGAQGPQGIPGQQGSQGPKGDAGQSFTIVGKLSSVDQLPAPTAQNRTKGYLVGNDTDGYDLYVVIGDTELLWDNVGKVEGVQGPQGPQGPAGEVDYNLVYQEVDNKINGIVKFSQSDVADNSGTLLPYKELNLMGSITSPGKVRISGVIYNSKEVLQNSGVTFSLYPETFDKGVEVYDNGFSEDNKVYPSIFLPIAQSNDIKLTTYYDPDSEYGDPYRWSKLQFILQDDVKQDIANSLKKSTTPNQLYGTDSQSNQTTYLVSSDNFSNSVPLRNISGNITVGDVPTSSGHATSKSYVDSKIKSPTVYQIDHSTYVSETPSAEYLLGSIPSDTKQLQFNINDYAISMVRDSYSPSVFYGKLTMMDVDSTDFFELFLTADITTGYLTTQCRSSSGNSYSISISYAVAS